MLFINSIINYIYLNQNNIYLLAKNTCNNKVTKFFEFLKNFKTKWKHYIPNFFETLKILTKIHTY
jgi:hypothetical protein